MKISIQKQKIANSRFIGQFQQKDILGQGTYGTVYRAQDTKNKREVAIKKMKVHDTQQGFPLTSLREVKVLNILNSHPNIVELIEVAVGKSKDSVFLIFEYCEMDLYNLFEQLRYEKIKLNEAEFKCLILQVIKGLSYAHQNFIVHRDLKLSNLLLNKSGIVKIADFGLAREFESPQKPMTKNVVTLWYRAPELLMEWKNYDVEVDVWSLGCIIGELFNNGVPLFQGNSEIHQFQLICETIGFPTKQQWPQFFTETKKQTLKSVEKFSVFRKNNLEGMFSSCSKSFVSLMKGVLTWNPRQRIGLERLMMHEFFVEQPRPCFPDEIRILGRLKELSKKSMQALSRKRAKQQQQQSKK